MLTAVDDEGDIRTEEIITGVEDEGVIRTEERKEICAGATLMATHAYTRNPESPLGKEIDLQQWDTLIFKGEHAENEHWRLVEDRYGQVEYAPAAFLVVILDTTAEEEESGATKKGQEDSTEENRIGGWNGQEGERRKSYSVAVIDGTNRNSRIYVGDPIVRKTDTILSRGEDVVVCLPGARIEHVTERVEQIMGRGYGGSILEHAGTNNTDKEGTTAIVEKYMNLLKKTKQARAGQIILSGIVTSVWKQDTRIQKFEEDGSQRDGEAALQGRGSGIRRFVGQLCGERRHVRERWTASEWKGGCSFCRGTVRGGCQWLG